jgi:hypothetical protein
VAWTWRLETADGDALAEPVTPAHVSQSEAESWLGEHWRDLRDQGVAQVALLDGSTQVDGPMSLSDA